MGALQMFFERPMPFYLSYPVSWMDSEEWEQNRDMQLMKSYYSERAARIQELAEQECDQMEYEGSRMYDEYPDPWMMRQICGRIRERLSEEEGELTASQREDESLSDLIGVLLYHEMYRRRCRRRKCRRFF